MKTPHCNCRFMLATMLVAAAGLGTGALAADDQPTPGPLRAAVLGAPGVAGAVRSAMYILAASKRPP